MRPLALIVTTSWLIVGINAVVIGEDAPAPQPDAAYQASDVPAEATNPANCPDLTGCWCGYWQSCVNNHTGPDRKSVV